mmetsp:Transcript_29364/g.82806  ORF Transcript_29364/g.82806 Transcript_29364/m.82806 type:complete len:194 (+) Transcript_29364:246-827(+)
MVEQQEEQKQLEQFPPPPSFYRLYAPAEEASPVQPAPPPPPQVIEGEYEQYGELHTTQDGVAPLPQHIQKLYSGEAPHVDFKGELLKLNKEVLFTFMELLNTAVEAPGLTPASRTQYDTHMMSLGLLMWNMHHLMNHMRPHQARATLEHSLSEQIAERRTAIRQLREQSEAAQRMITASGAALEKDDASLLPS